MTISPRRGRARLLQRALFALPVALGPALASAQAGADYPNRPLRLLVPFPPGGGNDILARTVGQRLAETLGQQVVVDNRAGAGGLIGASLAATAAPDGYTLFLGSLGNLAHTPALRAQLPYDPRRDFAPVGLLAGSAFILAVNPGVPARTARELIELARRQPGKLNYGSAGTGSSLHMTAELFKHVTGTDIVHVAYKGTAGAITDVIAGQVQMIFSTMPPALPHAKSGKLRAVGVTTAQRSAAVPDVPTIAESGVPGFEVSNWQGLVVPARTPGAIVTRLNTEIQKLLAEPAMIQALRAQGLEPDGGTPARFGTLIRDEIEKYTRLVRAASIRVD